VGDYVSVFLGEKVPFLIRQNFAVDDLCAYHFVGECYVHDLMNGEVLNEEASSGGCISWDSIELY
jgi:hypothetical protein